MAKISAEGSLRDPNISVELPDGCWLTKNLDVTADTNDIFNTKTVIIGIFFLKKYSLGQEFILEENVYT